MSNSNEINNKIERIKKLVEKKNIEKKARIHELGLLNLEGNSPDTEIRVTRGSYNIKENNENHFGSNNPDQLDLLNSGLDSVSNSISSFLTDVKLKNKKSEEITEIKKEELKNTNLNKKKEKLTKRANLLKKNKIK